MTSPSSSKKCHNLEDHLPEFLGFLANTGNHFAGALAVALVEQVSDQIPTRAPESCKGQLVHPYHLTYLHRSLYVP